jgi:hypothetical protein
MHPPLSEWDFNYIETIATPHESGDLEKKGAALMDLQGNRSQSIAELAKQVSAFANGGGGFVVYGIDRSGGLDAGVLPTEGRQPIKAWCEQLIPGLVRPSIHGCQAAFFSKAGHHRDDRGVLVVHVPLSEARPHWVPGQLPEVAYIRAGEHSVPMSLQTFIDLSHRQQLSKVAIVDLYRAIKPQAGDGGVEQCWVNPRVKLEAGPCCKEWAVDVKVPKGLVQLTGKFGSNVEFSDEFSAAFILGQSPLFAERVTAAANEYLTFRIRNREEVAHAEAIVTLYAGAAQPEQRRFNIGKLFTDP